MIDSNIQPSIHAVICQPSISSCKGIRSSKRTLHANLLLHGAFDDAGNFLGRRGLDVLGATVDKCEPAIPVAINHTARRLAPTESQSAAKRINNGR